jgi:hypothetical protein
VFRGRYKFFGLLPGLNALNCGNDQKINRPAGYPTLDAGIDQVIHPDPFHQPSCDKRKN